MLMSSIHGMSVGAAILETKKEIYSDEKFTDFISFTEIWTMNRER
jgi:hypothetical protein